MDQTIEQTSEQPTEQPSAPIRGRIQNMGVLNLLSAKSAADFEGITKIENVGCVMVPESLAAAAARIPMENVGVVASVPDGGKVSLICGQATFTGEALAEGDSETLLVVAGQLFITTPVFKVGYRGLHIMGQILAPRGSEGSLAAAITHLSGQARYFPVGARMFTGEHTISREFLEFIDTPIPLMITGEVEFTADVTVDLLRAKVSEIALTGEIKAPRALIPLLQFLAVENTGEIDATD